MGSRISIHKETFLTRVFSCLSFFFYVGFKNIFQTDRTKEIIQDFIKLHSVEQLLHHQRSSPGGELSGKFLDFHITSPKTPHLAMEQRRLLKLRNSY